MRPSCESTEANAGNESPQPNSPRITVKRLITHALSLTFGHGLRTDNHPPRPCSSHRRRREGDRSEPQCSASCSFVREVLGGSDRLRTPSTGSDRTSPRQVNRIPIATASPHSASNPADVCNAQPNRGETTATAMAVTNPTTARQKPITRRRARTHIHSRAPSIGTPPFSFLTESGSCPPGTDATTRLQRHTRAAARLRREPSLVPCPGGLESVTYRQEGHPVQHDVRSITAHDSSISDLYAFIASVTLDRHHLTEEDDNKDRHENDGASAEDRADEESPG